MRVIEPISYEVENASKPDLSPTFSIPAFCVHFLSRQTFTSTTSHFPLLLLFIAPSIPLSKGLPQVASQIAPRQDYLDHHLRLTCSTFDTRLSTAEALAKALPPRDLISR